MDSGYYAAFAGLVARTQALDTAASNLANATTAGYRAEREYFRSVLLDPLGTNMQTGGSQLGSTVNNYGVLGGDHLDLGQGVLTPTGDRVTVDQQTPLLHARLQAVALESAGIGQRVRVRLGAGAISQSSLSATVIAVLVTGAGQAKW